MQLQFLTLGPFRVIFLLSYKSEESLYTIEEIQELLINIVPTTVIRLHKNS